MKKTLFVMVFLSASAAFGQSVYGGGNTLSSEPIVYQSPSHPAHASYAPLSTETSVLAANSYSSAQGDRPASDFPQAEGVPLGTAARELKKQHDTRKKSEIVWVNE